MSQTIWKFPLEVTDVQTISMPSGARCLCVQAQGYGVPGIPERPCLWAMVDPTQETRSERRIWIVGTGHAVPEDAAAGTYLGTFQLMGGGLVFHVFASAQPVVTLAEAQHAHDVAEGLALAEKLKGIQEP